MALTTIRRWGSSLGIVIPKEMVEELCLEAGDEVDVPTILKEHDLSKIFGSLKAKESIQKMKDEARRGWKERSFSIPTR